MERRKDIGIRRLELVDGLGRRNALVSLPLKDEAFRFPANPRRQQGMTTKSVRSHHFLSAIVNSTA